MTKHNDIARRDFNRKTLGALSRKGITLIAARNMPGADGTFTNGVTGYILDDNGTQRIRTLLDVIALGGK